MPLRQARAMKLATALLLLLAAAIKLAPVVGVLGAERLRALCRVDVSHPVLAILLRHPALLFGVVGGLLAAFALHPELLAAAIVVGLVSAIGFIAICEARASRHSAGFVAARGVAPVSSPLGRWLERLGLPPSHKQATATASCAAATAVALRTAKVCLSAGHLLDVSSVCP